MEKEAEANKPVPGGSLSTGGGMCLFKNKFYYNLASLLHSFQLLIMHPLQRIKVELRPLFTNHRYEIYSDQIFWMFGKQFGLGDVQTNPQSFGIINIILYCARTKYMLAI